MEDDAIFNFGHYEKKSLGIIAKGKNDAFDEIQSVQCTTFWINDFYVYEMNDATIRVEVLSETELKVKYATHEVAESGWEVNYIY